MVLPTPGILISGIRKGNRGVIDSEYPYSYAHRFIAAYPETVPQDVLSRVESHQMISTPARTASATLQYWAEATGEEKYALARILADTYLSLHHRLEAK